MKIRLVRLAADPSEGIAVEIEVAGKPVVAMSSADQAAAGTDPDPRNAEQAVETELRSHFTENQDEIHVHKNRDGGYSYAVGLRPDQWPEDEDI